EDGGHLRDALEASDPEVILMDIQLPGLDGFELLRTVRSSLKSKVPVVALTAHAMVGDQDRAEAAGFNAYITKPIDVIKFPSQVEEVLNRNPGPGFA
ncbi:MAG: response regulator, partial [Gemmatimonadales bacterium]